MSSPSDLQTVFSAQGPLARTVADFRVRRGQLEMARAVEEAVRNNGVLVAEAGTGTGKTFAYLVPALLSGGKVIISTGTKTLQDQLYDRDIPLVRAALKVPVSVALLKGRANYVCRHHLERARHEGRFASREDASWLHVIAAFAANTQTGDKSDLAAVPENAGVWAYVTSTRENCLGSECEHYAKCFVNEARKQALAADVVVVNHHLFFADVALRDEGIAELLPAANTVIFDEAHQLPETASLFFGYSATTTQLTDLARDARTAAIESAKDYAPLPAAAQALDKAARDLRLVFREDAGRLPAHAVDQRRGFAGAYDTVLAALDKLAATLESQAERAAELERCWQRALALAAQYKRWRGRDDPDYVYWLEIFGKAVHCNATPLSIARVFREQITGQPRSWIFTSATLSVGGDFSHYRDQLGLDDAQALAWESPFDYANHALLYVPRELPQPNQPDFSPGVAQAALPVIEASGGRTFILCTSLRAVRDLTDILREAFTRRGWEFPLLAQGDGSRTELLERFRRLGNAVLVGSQSFWEGIDVRGEALSLVVIDKLPFAPPDDPLLAARIEMINRAGRNAFRDYQLPEAAIALKQGAGRLIRDESDRGVLMVCDPRLFSRSYGRTILRSLPPMRLTRELREVLDFLETTSTAG
jgi:ATP-dependent DNA helicase DinG